MSEQHSSPHQPGAFDGQQRYDGQPHYGQQPGVQPQYGQAGAMYGVGMSDKTKVVAGILQLLLGGLAAGRWYLGYTKIALMQMLGFFAGLVLAMIGVFAGILGADADGTPGGAFALVPVGYLIMLGIGIWVLVDAIRMFIGTVPDAQGRPLR